MGKLNFLVNIKFLSDEQDLWTALPMLPKLTDLFGWKTFSLSGFFRSSRSPSNLRLVSSGLFQENRLKANWLWIAIEPQSITNSKRENRREQIEENK